MSGPHDLSQVLSAGEPVAEATGAVVLLHGRGASARDILGLSNAFGGLGLAFVAPEAAGHTWYPQSFLAPRSANEPYLTSALDKIRRVVDGLVAGGIPTERIVISGFSQGACLSTEFVASHPARYAGLIAFTGGLVGPLGSDLHHAGELHGTPALLMSGDPDPHVPWSRVEESAVQLKAMGAEVTAIRYPGRQHTVSQDEIAHARGLLEKAFSPNASI
ncbi:alpha/beta hydrolase [Terriglobus roseus]|uniref:Phospholipase/carboxylesterase/glyoxalase family protein n=1 Tax=Terriglobus roseus TaxID=392734 RepID=A0A1H4QSJ7_9BACT|nr:alpha/beta hydrolase [Terriglobus roseus]SEC22605.1 phospholipase/carboxylesterase/glyoxalase family protein [Terriglobus roseus]